MSAGFVKKIGMTRLFVENKAVPVTVLQFQESFVLQSKTMEKDGYKAVQVAAVPKRKVTQAASGHVKKYLPETEINGFRLMAEFDLSELPEGNKFGIESFKEGELISVTGKTIGKGTAGAVKRWGFAGQPATHGHDHERAVGSMGQRWPQRVIKGMRMAGRLGNTNLTLNKVKIIAVDTELDLIFVNGSIPGGNSRFLKIHK